ncbi:hypothetical protein [Hymenobacter rubripertinctus]|uniref:Periplasmic heavy metal sensor n=1 Tax=Hymenobacter rubripertinctus TaxID=2029981 RepID=A0A418QXB9_9BACT|nr:hypothetical protein [Hymenobacter rubripertinctus]RIY09808.1 hypothetical protein D0T11_11605 [Hymenobacter rubripertinctus]
MKTFLLLAGLTLATAPGLLAQTPARPKPAARPATAPPAPVLNEEQIATRANGLTTNMQKALGLNPQQAERVGQINLVSVRNVETARHKYRQDVRKMAGVIETIGQSRLEMMKEVLSPAQFDKYQRKREEKMGVPSAPASQGNPAPGLPGY